MSIQIVTRVRWSDYYLQTYRNARLTAWRDSDKARAKVEYETMKAKRGTVEEVTERGLKILWDGNPLPHYCVDYLVTVVKE
jgi:hypothetical protein